MSKKTNFIASGTQPMMQETVCPMYESTDEPQLHRNIFCSGNTFVTRVRLVNGRVDEAWSTGRMIRNMNMLLHGELDSQGRPQFAHQAHCLCNDGHALAAIRALEDLADVVPPHGALLVRNMVQALKCIQEHLLHFYQFHLSDWMSRESALRANPAGAARLARHPQQDTEYFRRVQNRLRALDGKFSDHPDYCGLDELHLLIHAHGLESLRIAGMINTALSLLGCGSEGFKAYQLGGLSEDIDLGTNVRSQLQNLLAGCFAFVHNIFLPDLERLAQTYAHWADWGAGSAFLTWGDFDCHLENGPLYPGGMIIPGSGEQNGEGLWEVRPPHSKEIREEQEPDWSVEDRNRYRLHLGDDGPLFQWGEGEFSWLPAPRHGNEACEVGSLARVMGGWVLGRTEIRQTVAKTLNISGLAPAAMNSTLGRVLSRGIESSLLAQAVMGWLENLESSLARGPKAMRTDLILPSSGLGTGRVEVPRGTLTHTIQLERNRITNHDYLIPSLWNFSPRDSHGERGPLEHALLGTPVADPDHPLEIMRTVHELDPCNTCLVVIEDIDTGRTSVANAT